MKEETETEAQRLVSHIVIHKLQHQPCNTHTYTQILAGDGGADSEGGMAFVAVSMCLCQRNV